jgi:phosphoenolpyruvate carboxylase
LAEIIKLAKKKHYNNLLTKSTKKAKTTWKIINENINKRHGRQDISPININGVITQNNQVIANTFNSYYSSVAQHITKNFSNSNSVGNKHNPVNYLRNIRKQPLPTDKLKSVSPKEIENVAKSFKAKESSGYDEIPTKVINRALYTYHHLWHIYVT